MTKWQVLSINYWKMFHFRDGSWFLWREYKVDTWISVMFRLETITSRLVGGRAECEAPACVSCSVSIRVTVEHRSLAIRSRTLDGFLGQVWPVPLAGQRVCIQTHRRSIYLNSRFPWDSFSQRSVFLAFPNYAQGQQIFFLSFYCMNCEVNKKQRNDAIFYFLGKKWKSRLKIYISMKIDFSF